MMTNNEFAKTNNEFLKACESVTHFDRYQDFRPSKRQASKWRRKKGIAWKVANRQINLKLIV